MCLGVPARVMEIFADKTAHVDVDGNKVKISVKLTPQVKVGEYVLVHAGFAMDVIDESLAHETMSLLKEIQAYGQ
jgi:hydrogenase expression/formation protein HypC